MSLISRIYILQSLKPTDIIRSGKLLSNNLNGEIENDFSDIKTKTELFLKLYKIGMELNNTSGLTVIHFDCHGNTEGIGLYDDSGNSNFIKWEDLRMIFREFYVKSQIKPVISFSSCKGFNVMNLLTAFEPCPYDIITGSLSDIPFEDSVDGYTLFYKNLNNGKPYTENIAEVQTKYPELKFIANPADLLFESFWKYYKENLLSAEKIKERKRNIISDIISIRGEITMDQVLKIDEGLSKEVGENDYQRHKEIFYS